MQGLRRFKVPHPPSAQQLAGAVLAPRAGLARSSSPVLDSTRRVSPATGTNRPTRDQLIAPSALHPRRHYQTAAMSSTDRTNAAAKPEEEEEVLAAKKAVQDCEAEVKAKSKDAETGEASSSAAGAGAAAEVEAKEEEPALPPLSPQEFRVYNRMSEQMNYFHEHFRNTWTTLYNACANNKRPAGMSLKQFIDEGLHFISYLTTHHNIEETYLFPILARKMPEFQSGSSSSRGGKPRDNPLAAELLQQHREIHAGMDVFEEYLRACRNREVELEMVVLKEKMDSWGAVLWKHLDQEVKTLGAENMRKYWTLDEMRSFPM